MDLRITGPLFVAIVAMAGCQQSGGMEDEPASLESSVRGIDYRTSIRPLKVEGGWRLDITLEATSRADNAECAEKGCALISDEDGVGAHGDVPIRLRWTLNRKAGIRDNRWPGRPFGTNLSPLVAGVSQKHRISYPPKTTRRPEDTPADPIPPGTTATGLVCSAVAVGEPGPVYVPCVAAFTIDFPEEGEPEISLAPVPEPKVIAHESTGHRQAILDGHVVRIHSFWEPYELMHALDSPRERDQPWCFGVAEKPWRPLTTVQMLNHRLVVNGRDYGKLAEAAFVDVYPDRVEVGGKPVEGERLSPAELEDFSTAAANDATLVGRTVRVRPAWHVNGQMRTAFSRDVGFWTRIVCHGHYVRISPTDELMVNGRRFGKVSAKAIVEVDHNVVRVDGEVRLPEVAERPLLDDQVR